VYEIVSIKRTFQPLKFRPPKFEKSSVGGSPDVGILSK